VASEVAVVLSHSGGHLRLKSPPCRSPAAILLVADAGRGGSGSARKEKQVRGLYGTLDRLAGERGSWADVAPGWVGLGGVLRACKIVHSSLSLPLGVPLPLVEPFSAPTQVPLSLFPLQLPLPPVPCSSVP